MVTILLNFTPAQRGGNWALYLRSFRSVLCYFFRYDHLIYALEVQREFERGSFEEPSTRLAQITASNGSMASASEEEK